MFVADLGWSIPIVTESEQHVREKTRSSDGGRGSLQESIGHTSQEVRQIAQRKRERKRGNFSGIKKGEIQVVLIKQKAQ
jgi:hypothetical protein